MDQEEPGSLKYHNKRVAVTKSFTFDAAHRLERYEGKCKNLHGHTYRLVVTISGYLNEIGMAMDFGDIKALFQSVIKAKLDHQYLNEVLPEMNTTAENMIVWIWQQLEMAMADRGYTAQGHRLEALRLFETPTSSAEIRREWMVDDENDR
ncbi:6-carboxytetrahydropterin synthase QueD [Sporolactobacillus sp. THM7-4]|nr:6-carboxytetrahydropterin synthase QueD [Sporolactobacillus sp. THM7-4]